MSPENTNSDQPGSGLYGRWRRPSLVMVAAVVFQVVALSEVYDIWQACADGCSSFAASPLPLALALGLAGLIAALVGAIWAHRLESKERARAAEHGAPPDPSRLRRSGG